MGSTQAMKYVIKEILDQEGFMRKCDEVSRSRFGVPIEDLFGTHYQERVIEIVKKEAKPGDFIKKEQYQLHGVVANQGKPMLVVSDLDGRNITCMYVEDCQIVEEL